MNIIDKKKIAEGMLYNFHFPVRPTAPTIDFCIELKDLCKKHGYFLASNDFSAIEIIDSDTFRTVATNYRI